jgi:hypothetical protein
MTPTRREFIRNVGIAIASLAMARCIPFRGRGGSPRDRLRDCWLRLDWLARQAEGNYERGERARDDLVADHRAALDGLIAAGDLDARVADSVETAFNAASIHIVRVSAPITCYEPVEVDYTPATSDQLARQAELLAEVAEGGDLDPDAVAQARAAIERDIAF